MVKGRRGATIAEANSLREAILALPDLAPADVARQLCCNPQTVHNVRKNPRPDGRMRARERTRAATRMRWQLEEAEREATLDDLVDAPPPTGLLTGRGPGPVVDDPYADRAYDAYDVARSADWDSPAPEIALLRTQIRQTANQIHAPNVRLPAILALQAHMNDQIETLVRAMRAGRPRAATHSERFEAWSNGIAFGWRAQGADQAVEAGAPVAVAERPPDGEAS
jgi:hypothetical protein